MNPEEQQQHASECFDTGVPSPDMDASEDWDDWALIANHLQAHEVVALPEDFTQQVQGAIRRARLWSDLLLVAQTAGVTGVLLTCVTAWALGFDWWARLHVAVQPENIELLVRTVAAALPRDTSRFTALYHAVSPTFRLIPVALIFTATLALLIEFALFRFLRLGPFRLKNHIQPT